MMQTAIALHSRKCSWIRRIRGRTEGKDMQYITGIESHKWENRTAVTLGKFDELHRGHQKLVDKIEEYGKRMAARAFSALLTWEEIL